MEQLHAPGPRKTKIRVQLCSNFFRLFQWRCLSLKNRWVNVVLPLDYIQVFFLQANSWQLHPFKKRIIFLCFVFTRHKNVAACFLRAVTAGELLAYWLLPCIKLEVINMIWGKKNVIVFRTNTKTAQEWRTENAVLKVQHEGGFH